MTWQTIYSRKGNAFGILPNSEFYGPQGHRGQDYVGLNAGDTIYAYEHGVVALWGYSSIIGYYIVVRLDDGLYAGWAHVVGSSRIGVGMEVWPGSGIARTAGAGDSPGSAWAGAHIHTTLGPSVTSVYGGTVYNPAPRIAAATSATGAAGSGQESIQMPLDGNDKTWLNGLGDAIIDQTTRAFPRAEGILVRNADTGAVVWANLETGKWVGLAQGYPELLKSLGLIGNADGTQAPNLNVPGNVFGYLESSAASVRGVAGVAAQPVDVGALAQAVVAALDVDQIAEKIAAKLPADKDLTADEVIAAVRTVFADAAG